MRLFVGTFLSSLLLAIPISASAQQEEQLVTCPVDSAFPPAQSLIAYGTVSGGRLYLKRVAVKVGDVTLTPILDPSVEFGYIPESMNPVIRTHTISKRASKPTFTADKMGIEIDQRARDVQKVVRDTLASTLLSFSIEHHADVPDYSVSMRGFKPKTAEMVYPTGFDFHDCTLSQPALDAMEAVRIAKAAKKTGTAGRITLTPANRAY